MPFYICDIVVDFEQLYHCDFLIFKILKDMAELESAKQEGLVVEQAYKALRRSYDTKISQEKALLARLRVRRQVLGRGGYVHPERPPG